VVDREYDVLVGRLLEQWLNVCLLFFGNNYRRYDFFFDLMQYWRYGFHYIL